MKITSTRQIYLQPVSFKSISFHHQSQYFLEFQLKYRQSHIKESISAYPSIINSQYQTGFNKRKLFKPNMQNKAQSEKFLILFNDQTIILKGGCKFIVQTDRVVENTQQNNNRIESQLIIKLYRQHIQKKSNSQIEKDLNGKIQLVGQQKICINLNLMNDYSQYSSFRHIVFPNDQYFSSFLFYINFAHLGMNIRQKNCIRLDQFNRLNQFDQNKKSISIQKTINLKYKDDSLRSLLDFKQLKKWYKILIEDRIIQFKRIVQIYRHFLSLRIKYLKNYQLKQSMNLPSTSSMMNSQFKRNFSLSLNYLQENESLKDNDYFLNYYQTDDINEVYSSMFNQSKIIDANIRSVWALLINLNLKTLPQQFQHSALKFKIDRLRYISQFYSIVDEFVYTDEKQIRQRIKNHNQQRNKVCRNSKFYNVNQLKHSMITFHSQKTQNVISNSSEKQQSQILVVLVHGFKGSQRDMAKIKSFINTFTAINFLPLQSLDKLQNEDIISLGKKGADQITSYLSKKTHISSINFIGFSLGGIVIKAIISHLSGHKQKFNLFLTLSSPHLGITELQNCLVKAGVFVMKKVIRTKNIRQLCFQPSSKSKDITLVSLSQNGCLSWFKHVVLIGSNQDGVIPKYSALLAYRGDNKVVKQIQQNTLKSIKSLDRITVWFDHQLSCTQNLTGRKGHINFIEDQTFLEYIIIKYLHFF